MGNKVTDELLPMIRSIVGQDYSDMDIIRALHMSNNDCTAAINIILDTPKLKKPEITAGKGKAFDQTGGVHMKEDGNNVVKDGALVSNVGSKSVGLRELEITTRKLKALDQTGGVHLKRDGDNVVKDSKGVEGLSKCSSSSSSSDEWWFVGCSDVAGLSTCKGRSLKCGEEVNFTFAPERKETPRKFGGGRGRGGSASSEIVRFSSKACGEIGRIPNEWARCLLPLVRDKKIRIEGSCKSAPAALSLMDTIILSLSVYINSSMFHQSHQSSLKATGSSTDDSVIHPLPTMFRLLGLTPFKKAEFTPSDLCTKSDPLNSKEKSDTPATLLHLNKFKNASPNGDAVENEESISDADLDDIVGVGDSSELEEMDPPITLQCKLRPYQKQALYWMLQLEKGQYLDEAATTLHPCWDAYRLADKRELVVYVNSFSGDATVELPSTLQMARGGILADAMGLGKTIMTISLLLAHSEKGGRLGNESTSRSLSENIEADRSPPVKKAKKFPGFDKVGKQQSALRGGGNLIVCPMTLLGQWKDEIEAHSQPGSLSIYLHYGQTRSKDSKLLARNDVVLTTYGVLASEFSAENAEDNGGLYSVRWFRVVLDEAHTIKNSKSQISTAAAALIADRRWCLTGTPIQNNLEDIYSLLRFLRVEPWGSWAWWNKLVQKPFEGGDERGLKLVQSILRPIMLRRTKFSTDREGRPILVLPPADTKVIYCAFTEAEKDFYDALFKRSKVKFDQFVEQGRVLHNYASILELLLRLRQCCDHPFLVMSRGDTQEFSDLNKLAKRFLKGGSGLMEGEAKEVPSRAYVQEVVEELRKGDEGECPICLEAFEDAVLTPCAHRICRECLLASWQSHTSGLCPVCRKTVTKHDLITAPTSSRFQVDIEKNWVESSKVSTLLSELENLRSSGSKSIIFSQWTAFLDLLQIPLSRSKFAFLRLDGTLNQQQREKVLKQFSEDSNILVLLMSLKAGGVGINLTAASNAFVMDPWWNPAVEEQAVMRIHRIGQTNSVNIRRFIVKGTVEERMEAVQARKQRMISGALTDQEVRSARLEELKMLFT
ncbi:putative SWI/SNF-related matrix-associated actin-dependent regulator of chromatin subfamily A member 3-like 2 [Heracleum sosnowskyi]|uniref:SWI/SNF-related matrix-associated actin-dependent regulator of chromatin subfamily A member 3-like 2 n=1 Tax=Heracleum sosnowskyi TaxID=360622 RepID=A0AAD8ICN8_9APIA|nr:putative SWI/SNF-related matrix-associated actin-dependent regulator of chromatin subfamily A member 3-like 2 [Heracleum sosnowskyi]